MNIYSLQSELDACKNSPEEKTCQELRKELGDLQRKSYHKQMKLQAARQNRMVAAANMRNRGYHYTSQQDAPRPSGSTDHRNETESMSLMDDEWLEAGALDDFDSDEDIGMETEWDIEEMELDMNPSQSTFGADCTEQESGEKNTTSLQKNYPPASSGTYQSAKKHFQAANLPVNAVNPRKTSKWQASTSSGASFSSPLSSNIARKRPGESIFKAPKTHSQTLE